MMHIRNLNINDVNVIYEIGRVCEEFSCITEDCWQKQELEDWFQNENSVCIGLFNDNNFLIGYCLSHISKPLNKVFIENIWISVGERRKGLGQLLISNLLTIYNDKFENFINIRFTALTFIDNYPTKKLFEKSGFTIGEQMFWIQKQGM